MSTNDPSIAPEPAGIPSPIPPAGWYPDPENPSASKYRYWDGQQWAPPHKTNTPLIIGIVVLAVFTYVGMIFLSIFLGIAGIIAAYHAAAEPHIRANSIMSTMLSGTSIQNYSMPTTPGYKWDDNGSGDASLTFLIPVKDLPQVAENIEKSRWDLSGGFDQDSDGRVTEGGAGCPAVLADPAPGHSYGCVWITEDRGPSVWVLNVDGEDNAEVTIWTGDTIPMAPVR